MRRNQPASRCLGDATLRGLLEGQLDREAQRRLDRHVDECRPCFELVSGLARLRSEPSTGPEASARTSPGLEELSSVPTGAQLGRYVVQGRLGAGGMGIVYAAYDPELDRRVALKLLRTGALGTEAARGLLYREARAMARLSHPNVVAVHDAGTHGDQLFVAMELVEGLTLDRWCATRAPSTRELIELFRQAATGLAAAHAAGLVHRDFKPSNVLVEAGGRVRVTDFGLAHLARAEPQDPAVPSSVLGRTGAGAGTPAYMSPEQFLGTETGPATDQFSFCVTFCELLYGQRPFTGADVSALRSAVLRGEARVPHRKPGVPSWVRGVLLRGLRVDPSQRHPSMVALAEAIGRDRGLRSRRLAIGAVLLAAAASPALLAAVGANPSAAPCRGGPELSSQAWGHEQRERLRSTFLALHQPAARSAWSAVQSALDQRARSWESGFKAACEATWLRHTQSEALLDLRMACLTSRLAEQRALVAVLAQGGEDLVETAPRAVHRLTPIEDCADAPALAGRAPLPRALRGPADAVETILASGRAELAAGRFAEAREGAGRALEAARAVGHRPLEAEVLVLKAQAELEAGALPQAEQSARDGMRAAEVGRHDAERARALILLVDIVGRRLGRVEEGLQLGRDAEALVARLGGDRLAGLLALSTGGVLDLHGDHTAAIERFARAAEQLERTSPADSPTLATALEGLGKQQLALGRYPEARALEERALALRERALGPAHPDVALSLNGLGVAERNLGDLPSALAHQQRALQVQLATIGADHPATAATRGSLASTWLALGQHAPALREYEESLRVRRERLGADHPEAISMLIGLGNLSALQGHLDEASTRYLEALGCLTERPDADRAQEALIVASLGAVRREQGLLNEATELAERALSLRRAAFGEDHPAVASSLTELGHLARARRRPADAVASYQSGLRVLEARLGYAHPEQSDSLGGLGLALLSLDDPARAARFLERALAVRPAEDPDPAMRGELRLGLATALSVDGGNQKRATELATAAAADLARTPFRRPDLQRAAARWPVNRTP